MLIVFDYFILFISDICRAFSLNNTFFKRISKRRIVTIILFFLKTFNMKLLILLSVNALLISDLYRTGVLSIANKENLVTQIFRSHDLSIIFNGEIWKFWLISITIFFAFASIEFSTNSLITEDGLSTTSPAAILPIVNSSKIKISCPKKSSSL